MTNAEHVMLNDSITRNDGRDGPLGWLWFVDENW
jgi:hypothetical protein